MTATLSVALLVIYQTFKEPMSNTEQT
jgi:hypothetical protein